MDSQTHVQVKSTTAFSNSSLPHEDIFESLASRISAPDNDLYSWMVTQSELDSSGDGFTDSLLNDDLFPDIFLSGEDKLPTSLNRQRDEVDVIGTPAPPSDADDFAMSLGSPPPLQPTEHLSCARARLYSRKHLTERLRSASTNNLQALPVCSPVPANANQDANHRLPSIAPALPAGFMHSLWAAPMHRTASARAGAVSSGVGIRPFLAPSHLRSALRHTHSHAATSPLSVISGHASSSLGVSRDSPSAAPSHIKRQTESEAHTEEKPRKRRKVADLENEISQLRQKITVLEQNSQRRVRPTSKNAYARAEDIQALQSVLNDPNATPKDIDAALGRYKEKWADFGSAHGKALRDLLQQLHNLVNPYAVTRMTMWLLHQKSSFYDQDSKDSAHFKGGAWAAICQELELTQEQEEALLSMREAMRAQRQSFVHVLELLGQLQQAAANNFLSLECQMNQLMSVLSSKQIAKFILWIEQNKSAVAVLNALWGESAPVDRSPASSNAAAACSPRQSLQDVIMPPAVTSLQNSHGPSAASFAESLTSCSPQLGPTSSDYVDHKFNAMMKVRPQDIFNALRSTQKSRTGKVESPKPTPPSPPS